jgi:acetylornithine deacetylase
MDVASLTSRLVQIPSVNPMGRSLPTETCFEHRVTDFLASLFRDWDLAFERHVVSPASSSEPIRENILALLPAKPELTAEPELTAVGSLLLLEVHQDTVPVDGMTISPWSGQIENDRVYGRGACDIKGGMAAMLVALGRLQRVPPAERPHVVLACTVNEEHGFTGATHLRELWQSGKSRILPRAPDAILVAEPTQLNVVVAHKGCVRWHCQTHGVAAHSSAPEKGLNAIYALAPVLTALQKYASDIVPTLGSNARLTPPTLSVGTVHGGISVNTVPDCCEIEIDHRVLPGQDPLVLRQQAIDYLGKQLNDTISVTHSDPYVVAQGLSDEYNGPLAESLIAVIRSQGHDCSVMGVPYGTDAAVLSQDSSPTVVFGPGDVAQAHTADEWVSIDQLRAAADIIYEFARRFSRSKGARK